MSSISCMLLILGKYWPYLRVKHIDIQLHSLCTHLNSTKFMQVILEPQRECTPMIDIIYNWLLIPLPSVSQPTYADHAACAIEAIQEFIFHWPPSMTSSSNARPLRDRTNCFTKRSPPVPTLLQFSMKCDICCFEFPLSLN